MIFVSLGTQDKPFIRILENLEKWPGDEKIIVQAGFTKYASKRMEIHEYLTPEAFAKALNDARIVICHGGVGTIMKALHAGKVVIACPRLAKYGEHQNDHQVQIVDNFAGQSYLLAWHDGDDISMLMQKAENFKPRKIESNRDNFLKRFARYIESL